MRSVRFLAFILSVNLLATFGCNCGGEVLQRVEEGTLSGVYCSEETGVPVWGAEITFRASEKDFAGATDERGTFEFREVPAGTHDVTFADGDTERVLEVVIVHDEVTQLTDTACRGEYLGAGVGDITGQICDRHIGSLVKDAEVTIVLATGDVLSTRTDDDGAFEISDVPAGEHIVTVTATGYSRSWPIMVVAGEVFRLETGRDCAPTGPTTGLVTGYLCDLEGEGQLEGARVTAIDARGERFEDRSDTDGTFTLGPMAPGVASIEVEGPEGLISLTTIVRAGDEVFITNGGSCVEEACDMESVEPVQTSDGTLLLVVDRSGSMNFPAPDYGTTKWAGMTQSVQRVTAELTDAVKFGLQLFPDRELDNSCSSGSVVVEPEYGNAAEIADALDDFRSSPNGATPTSATLRAARNYLAANAVSGERTSVVLATDGAPNCNGNLSASTCTCTSLDGAACSDPLLCLDDADAIAEVVALNELGVETYVIGVPGVEDFSGVLDEIAVAGGTASTGAGAKYIEASNLSALEEAFRAIGRSFSPCVITIEDISGTSSISIDLGGSVFAYDPAHVDGFDVTSPTTIELFGAACEEWQEASADLTIETCTISGEG